MRVLLQRVSRAEVRVGDAVVGRIGTGVVLLVGVRAGDTEAEAAWLARKVAGLRVFPGEGGGFDRSVLQRGGGALVVSQFTLYGDARKGRRPNFGAAAPGPEAEALVEAFAAALRAEGVPVETGRFGAMMDVELVNDGPVTLVLEREASG